MVFFLRDVCRDFDEERFRLRVLHFHECLTAERERMRENTEASRRKAAMLRRKLAIMFDEIDPNPRRRTLLEYRGRAA
jgi:hypothetical protein